MVATTGYKYVRVEELADIIRSIRHVVPFLYLDFRSEQRFKNDIKMNACMDWESRISAKTMPLMIHVTFFSPFRNQSLQMQPTLSQQRLASTLTKTVGRFC